VNAQLPTALGAMHSFPPADLDHRLPAIAGYEILGELGRGGMGVVFKARHIQLNRLVALKMILNGPGAGPDEHVRFLAEAEAIAALHHTGIVQVHDFGTHEGQPYFSLELCPGGSLAQRLAANPLPARSAACLVAVVARAVHAAHAAGIVHRDLKPANILFGDGDTPKVSDFGLAKRINTGPGLTQTGLLLGTPSYKAPEQARGSKEVGPAADVWALGAILYECLTGRPPFHAATPLETLFQVQNDDPVPPSRLLPKVPRDLQTICLKCLEKEPRKRYATAQDLADDLGRFLDNQSIHARRSSPFERGWRWYRRNLVTGSMAGCVLLLLLILGGGGSLAAVWLRRERDDAVSSREQAQQAERNKTELLWEAYQAQPRLGHRSRESGQRLGALEVIRRAAAIRPSFGLRNDAIACLAVPDVTPGPAWDGFPPGTIQLAFDGPMQRYARSDGRSSISVRRVADDQEILRLNTRGCAAYSLEFSPDGLHLAANCGTGGGEPNQAFRVWEVDRGREVVRTRGRLPGRSFAFSPDGRLLATGRSDGTLVVYRLPDGQEAHRLPWGPVRHISFHPDGRRLTLTAATRVQVVDVATGEVTRSYSHPFTVNATAWSPDGRFLASACSDWSIVLWDAAEPGRPLHVLRGHLSLVNQVAFNHAGDLLASSGWDETVRLWSPFTGTLLVTTQEGHSEGGGDPKLRFSDDDRQLAFGRDSGSKAWLWQVTGERVYRIIAGPRNTVSCWGGTWASTAWTSARTGNSWPPPTRTRSGCGTPAGAATVSGCPAAEGPAQCSTPPARAFSLLGLRSCTVGNFASPRTARSGSRVRPNPSASPARTASASHGTVGDWPLSPSDAAPWRSSTSPERVNDSSKERTLAPVESPSARTGGGPPARPGTVPTSGSGTWTAVCACATCPAVVLAPCSARTAAGSSSITGTAGHSGRSVRGD
jgi:hypothetical protein